MVSLFLLFSLLNPPKEVEPSFEKSQPALITTAGVNKELILKLVNDARRKGVQCGDVWHPPVPPLTWNIQLEAAATLHSADMYRKKYFSHIEDDGSTANTRIEKVGYIWMTYGENIAFGYATEEAVVEGWLKSPGHCKNIMNKAFKEVGIGRVGDYWTQDFGSK